MSFDRMFELNLGRPVLLLMQGGHEVSGRLMRDAGASVDLEAGTYLNKRHVRVVKSAIIAVEVAE